QRKAFLISKKPEYALAVAENHVVDAVATIQWAFLKRFPLDHNIKPSPEELALVDNNTPDPEPCPPDPSATSNEEFEAAMNAYKERQQM
ncbi:hypothetical protein H0H92_003574, partial [Tricholoma furcatifolium]